MKKFTKRVVAVVVSAVITVASAGMAFGNNIYYYSKCPNCGNGVTVTEGTQIWSQDLPCKHGYDGVEYIVNFRAHLTKQECAAKCGWRFDTITNIEEMSRICHRIRRVDIN